MAEFTEFCDDALKMHLVLFNQREEEVHDAFICLRSFATPEFCPFHLRLNAGGIFDALNRGRYVSIAARLERNATRHHIPSVPVAATVAAEGKLNGGDNGQNGVTCEPENRGVRSDGKEDHRFGTRTTESIY
jgi:hypothetical protein